MDFTPLFAAVSVTQPSANGEYVASVVKGNRLVVRTVESLSIKRIVDLPSAVLPVRHVRWSPLGRKGPGPLFMVASDRAAAVYSIADEAWSVEISESDAAGGVAAIEFDPAGNNVFIWSDFQLRLTIWSLIQQRGDIVQSPKFPDVECRGGATTNGISFRASLDEETSPYFALLCRRNARDHISIFRYRNHVWRHAKTWPLPTMDAQCISWSPDGKWIAVAESAVNYKLYAYTISGQLVRMYSASAHGAGIRSMEWMPRRLLPLLALGSFDNKVRLLNSMTFTPVIEFTHSAILQFDGQVWRELSSSAGGNENPTTTTEYELSSQPTAIPLWGKSSGCEGAKTGGISHLSFNIDGTLLATVSEQMPSTLWIWSLDILGPLAVLIHREPIKSLRWCPHDPDLLVLQCHAGIEGQSPYDAHAACLYFWNRRWAEPRAIHIPRPGFELRYFRWCGEPVAGRAALIAGDRTEYTVGYVVENENEDDKSEEEGPCVITVSNTDENLDGLPQALSMSQMNGQETGGEDEAAVSRSPSTETLSQRRAVDRLLAIDTKASRGTDVTSAYPSPHSGDIPER